MNESTREIRSEKIFKPSCFAEKNKEKSDGTEETRGLRVIDTRWHKLEEDKQC
jgi:hypothetical protein